MQMYLMIVSTHIIPFFLLIFFLSQRAGCVNSLIICSFLFYFILFFISVSLTSLRYGWLAHILHKEGGRTLQGEFVISLHGLHHVLMVLSAELSIIQEVSVRVRTEIERLIKR
jgi:hypothetical protein